MKCTQCGKDHPQDLLEPSFRRPDAVHRMPTAERAAHVRETDDQCRIKDERFFVRGLIPLRVEGRDQRYCVGAWVEVDAAVYARIAELWDDPNQAAEPAFEARLANRIPLLPETVDLKVQLKLTGRTTRPEILIPPSDHPLHREQCAGITAHRAYEYAALFRK